MKRILQLAIISAPWFLWGMTGFAQAVAPVPELANMTAVGPEGVTVTATTASVPIVVQLCYNPTTCAPAQMTPKLPLEVSCATSAPCALLGGDPAVGETKTLYVQQQAAAFTVTVTDGTTPTVAVPALPVVVVPVTPSYIYGYTLTLDATGKVIGATCTAPVVGQ